MWMIENAVDDRVDVSIREMEDGDRCIRKTDGEVNKAYA